MGAGELLIIAVIGLVVLGPERLPVAIRTVSGWIRSAKQMANGLTQEINHELKVQELHQNLKKAEEQGLQNLSPELSQTVQELKDAAASVTHSYEPSATSQEPSASIASQEPPATSQKPALTEEPRSPFSPKPVDNHQSGEQTIANPQATNSHSSTQQNKS